ncbi:MAG: PilZ domain-containing protein [Candidatus Omnitrophota bacterium]|jgi:hypothetical protein
MFTKEDYKKYFDQLARAERMMIYGAHDILSRLNDDSIKAVLENIAQDELRHYTLVRDAMDALLIEGEAEKRKYQRESSFGNIEVKRTGAAQKTEAWCINIAQDGVCMESNEPFKAGDKIALSIMLYDKEQPIHKTGVVIWTKETQPNFYISGVEFERSP